MSLELRHMAVMASQIIGICTSFSRVLRCPEESFSVLPAQRTSNAWNISMSWRHHGSKYYAHRTDCTLMCFIVVFYRSFYQQRTWLFSCHRGKDIISPMPVKQHWRVWVHQLQGYTESYNIMTTKHKQNNAVNVFFKIYCTNHPQSCPQQKNGI